MNPTSRRLAASIGAGAALFGASVVAVSWPEDPPPPAGGAVAVVASVDGRELVTHGNDSPPPPQAAPGAPREVAWPCVGDGQDGPRVQMLYVHSGDDRLDAQRANFESYARSVQGAFFDSSGGQRLVRYVTEADCSLSILSVTVSPNALKDFGRLVSELDAQGFDRTDRKYHAWMDGFDYCGIGTILNDDRADAAGNANNTGPSYSLTGGLCRRYAEAHEIAHNLGAVQLSAPNSTGGWHCTDESDLMCYADGGPKNQMRQVCGASHEDRLDCGGDDYFAVVPDGSYLASHWNVADSSWLESGSPPTTQPPPTTSTTLPPTTTSTTLGTGRTTADLSAPTEARVGQDVRLVARVTGSCGPDGGVVRFYQSGRRMAQVVLENGQAEAVLRFSRPGRFTARVDYRGSETCAFSRDSVKVSVRA